MKLSISIDGTPLKLPPGAVLDIEETNPFLQLNDNLVGDFSYPITVPIKGNEKALKHVQLLQTTGKINTYDNVIVTDGAEYASGILKNEQVNANLNGGVTDYISMYFLKGSSHFFKDVENKTLVDLDFQFVETCGSALDTIRDYGTQIVRTGTPDTKRFALFDVYNTTIGDIIPEVNIYNFCSLNKPTNGLPFLQTSNPRQSVITPQPYVNYLIKRCFESFGWQVSGFIFSDEQFKKLAFLSTGRVNNNRDIQNGVFTMDLKYFVPAIKISSFLIALKNRFGWWYDFDYIAKKCTIRKIDDVFNGENRIDITGLVEPIFSNKIANNVKKYGLSAGSDAPDQSLWDFKGALSKIQNLPAANAGRENYIYFVASENAYYVCTPNTPYGTDFTWKILTQNDFSYFPPGKTDEISTICMVPTMVKFAISPAIPPFASDLVKMIPEISIEDDNGSTDSFYVAFHYGMQEVEPFNHNPVCLGGLGTAGAHAFNGTKVGTLSANYSYIDPNTGNDIGLAVNFWNKFLGKQSNQETIELNCRFTPQQVIGFKWDATYLINNTEYIVQKRRRQLPYNGRVALTLVRV